MLYLDSLVPSTRYNDGVAVRGGEPYAGHPVRVTILLDCVFALGKCVPQLKIYHNYRICPLVIHHIVTYKMYMYGET